MLSSKTCRSAAFLFESYNSDITNIYAACFRTEDLATSHLGWKTQPPSGLNPIVVTLRIYMLPVLGQNIWQHRNSV
jgi:hypothetical protein